MHPGTILSGLVGPEAKAQEKDFLVSRGQIINTLLSTRLATNITKKARLLHDWNKSPNDKFVPLLFKRSKELSV